MVLSRNSRHLANDFDGYEEKLLPSSLDVIKRVQGAIPVIFLYTYRPSKISLERIYNKYCIKMQSGHMAEQRASVEKNLSSLPASQLAYDVLLILSHIHPIVDHTNGSAQ